MIANEAQPMVMPGLNRRDILKAGLAGFMGALPFGFCIPNAEAASGFALPKVGSFSIALQNQHTGEVFNGTYRVGNKYLPEAFEQINYVLRDFRTGDVFPIDPRAVDILYMIREKAGIKRPQEILSGYRSPRTNDMLRHASGGVAKNSLHLTGQAIDSRIPGFSTRKMRDLALSLRAGGVGYYPNSNFVHIDTGMIRSW